MLKNIFEKKRAIFRSAFKKKQHFHVLVFLLLFMGIFQVLCGSPSFDCSSVLFVKCTIYTFSGFYALFWWKKLVNIFNGGLGFQMLIYLSFFTGMFTFLFSLWIPFSGDFGNQFKIIKLIKMNSGVLVNKFLINAMFVYLLNMFFLYIFLIFSINTKRRLILFMLMLFLSSFMQNIFNQPIFSVLAKYYSTTPANIANIVSLQ